MNKFKARIGTECKLTFHVTIAYEMRWIPLTRIHVIVEMLVVVQPDLGEPRGVDRQGVHLGSQAPRDGMGCAISVHMPNLSKQTVYCVGTHF